MNEHSIICRYIKEHPSTWQDDMEQMNISFKIDDFGLCIFKYGIGADFSSPIVCEARGIIIDLNTLDVAGVGFNKFFNSHEPYAASIDWRTARVQEKEDGAILKLFYNRYAEAWQWSTNGTLNAANAECTDMFHDSYLSLIKGADNYADIAYDRLDQNKTYIFEIVDPLMHVIHYPAVHLYHIGTRSNITLEETVEDIGIEHPKEYPLSSLEECRAYVETLNEEDNVQHEGFVVVDGSWNRIKVKNSIYLKMHYYANNGVLTKARILELLETDDFDPDAFVSVYPQYKPVIDWYMAEKERVHNEITAFVASAREVYEACGHDRKAAAEQISSSRYASFGFRALGNTYTADDLIRMAKPGQIEKLIRDYKEENK